MRISDWSSDVCSSDLRQQIETPKHRRGADDIGRRAAKEPFDLRCAAAEHHQTHAHRNEGEQRPGIGEQIGRASCREKVCQYVSISVVGVSLKKKNPIQRNYETRHYY